jgi:hypothetical protein
MRPRTSALIAAMLTVVCMHRAVADPEPTRTTLDWDATPECMSGARVLKEVARLAGGASDRGRRITAHVRLTQTDDGAWHVALETQTDEGTRKRSFDAESCEAAAAGVAFMLAIAENPAVIANPIGEAPLSPRETSPPPHDPSAASLEPPPSTTPRFAPNAAPSAGKALDEPDEAKVDEAGPGKARRAFSAVAALAMGFDTGTLPRATLGPTASIGLAPGRWRLDLTGAFWTSKSATLPARPTGASFEAWSAEARAAYGWRFGPFRVGPMVGLGVEATYATGFGGTVANLDTSALTATFGAGGFTRWCPGGAFALRLEVVGEVPFERPSFSVREPVPPNSLVFRLPVAMARASVGVDVVF